MGATWNKNLTEKVAMAIGEETLAAGTMQAWSPVLDVAQDARWGRCEETFGEDPVLVSISLKGCLQLRNILEVMVHLWGDVIRTI